jgi:hypothetical protein
MKPQAREAQAIPTEMELWVEEVEYYGDEALTGAERCGRDDGEGLLFIRSRFCLLLSRDTTLRSR